jgi:hypothetical protein
MITASVRVMARMKMSDERKRAQKKIAINARTATAKRL